MAFANSKSSDQGLPLVATAPYAYSDRDKSRYKGVLYSAPEFADTAFDMRLDDAVRLYGGHYWVMGAKIGDTITFQVVDKDNVLGGGADVVVTEYITTMPVPGWDHERDLASPTAALIPAGLYLRVIYHNDGDGFVTLGVTYKWFLQEPTP